MSPKPIQIVFGTAGFQPGRHFGDKEAVAPLLDALEATKVVTKLDTAQIYGASETILGETGAGRRFTIDTKAPGGFVKGSLSSEKLVWYLEDSLKKLKVDKVDIFYIHAPEIEVPLADWLPGVQQLYEAGKFSRFGVSNFQASHVADVHAYCAAHSYVLPSVYQGNYSAVARLQETLLFPTLRRLGIAFYAYSPIAGGFLTKTPADLQAGKGRFDPSTPVGKMYSTMYGKESYVAALQAWADLSEAAGVSRAEAAYRWVAWNAALKAEYGDAVILGANGIEQAQETVAWILKGPLDDATVARIQEVWETIKDEAPLDNYHR